MNYQDTIKNRSKTIKLVHFLFDVPDFNRVFEGLSSLNNRQIFVLTRSNNSLFTKFWSKKTLWNFLSLCYIPKIYLAYYIYFLIFCFCSYNGNSGKIIGKFYCLNHGWLRISLTPFKDPILWFGFFAKRPFMSDLTYFETNGCLGNLG